MAKNKVKRYSSIDRLTRLSVIQDYAALWQQFFTFFADDISERQFTEEEEQEFSNTTSLLALNQFKFQECSKGYFKESDTILKVLEEGVSLLHLQLMPEASLNKLQIEWHTLFISMNKAIGKIYKELTPKELDELQSTEDPA